MTSKAILRIGFGLAAALYLSACASATIRPEGGAKSAAAPAYEESKNYFFWGLSGEHDIDVVAACQGKAVDQFQSQITFVDGIKTFFTLGIWAPKTAKVWCK